MAFTIGNLSINSDGRLWRRRAPPAMALQLVVPNSEQRGFIQRFNICRTFGYYPDCL